MGKYRDVSQPRLISAQIKFSSDQSAAAGRINQSPHTPRCRRCRGRDVENCRIRQSFPHSTFPSSDAHLAARSSRIRSNLPVLDRSSLLLRRQQVNVTSAGHHGLRGEHPTAAGNCIFDLLIRLTASIALQSITTTRRVERGNVSPRRTTGAPLPQRDGSVTSRPPPATAKSKSYNVAIVIS